MPPTPRTTRSCRSAWWRRARSRRPNARSRLRASERATVLARGGGTSQAGQTVSESLVVDCSKYLTRILDLDVKRRRAARSSPASCSTISTAQLKPHGLWFPVDISTASRATIGGMAGNNSCGGRSMRYGTMRDNVISIEALLADGTLAHFGRIGGNLDDVPAPLRPLAERSARDRRARGRRDRRALPQGAAPGRRLQSRRAGAGQERHQPRARAGRRRRHARLFRRASN